MANANDHSHIQGWGADLDRANRPAVPMERTPPRLDVPWDTPEQQSRDIEVLHSIERPGISKVFGTSVPPSGVSGMMRRCAFRRSENDLRHWLMLMAADRVNVVEGVVDDVRRSPKSMALLGVGVVAVAAWWLARRD